MQIGCKFRKEEIQGLLNKKGLPSGCWTEPVSAAMAGLQGGLQQGIHLPCINSSMVAPILVGLGDTATPHS